MSLDRILAVAGVILSLPGFLLLFLNRNETVGAAFVLLGLVVLLAALIYHYWTEIQPYTVIEMEGQLVIKTRDGASATLTKQYRIRPNYSHLNTLTHRSIASDGRVENIRWDDQPVPPANISRVLGEYHVTVNFRPPKQRFKAFDGKLSYDLLDSFPASREVLGYVADFPTKQARISVELPADRPCHNAEVYVSRGAGEKLMKPPTRSANRCSIAVTLKRPATAARYNIYWDW